MEYNRSARLDTEEGIKLITTKKKKDLTEGSIFKGMIAYAVPLMLTGLLQLFYNAADTVVVGQFSAEAETSLAAVGSTGSLTTLILNLILGLSAGTTVVVAQRYGSKDYEGVERAVHTSIAVSVIGGLFFAMIGFFGARVFLGLMDSPPDVIGKATLYMRICFIGVPANVIYNFGSSILRATGDTKRPLIILSTTGMINVLLNLLLVIVFHLDVAGVAIATITSQYLSAIIIILILLNRNDCLKLDLKKLSIHKETMLVIVRVGLPSGVQGCMFSISNVLIQSAVNSLPTATIAGNTIAANLGGFTYTVMNSFYQAELAFAGQNYGAKRQDRVNASLWIGLAQVAVVGFSFGMGELLLGRQLAALYNSDPIIIEAAYYRMSMLLPTYFLCGMMEVMVGNLRGMGCSFVPMLSSVFGACIFRSGWILIVFERLGTPFSLYISYPISWLLTLVLHAITLAVVRSRHRTPSHEEGILQ
ncbi:MAG: MATE family efflux transporter [Clostridia bacterium]|nr:MATE family efflux transporter [Clostridia bacterium]